jgi:hypothetical protein
MGPGGIGTNSGELVTRSVEAGVGTGSKQAGSIISNESLGSSYSMSATTMVFAHSVRPISRINLAYLSIISHPHLPLLYSSLYYVP